MSKNEAMLDFNKNKIKSNVQLNLRRKIQVQALYIESLGKEIETNVIKF